MRTLLPLLILSACGPDVSVSKVATDADNDGYDQEVDCDDGRDDVNPTAPERCDGRDNDCDGVVDDDPSDANEYYPDADGDGFGDGALPVTGCEAPAGFVADASDCDDADGDDHPGGVEVCNDDDEDCDGVADNGAIDVITGFLDADGDGYGVAESDLAACELPEGYVEDSTDCDDAVADVHPGAEESDCRDPVDYNCDGTSGYADLDADGWAACEDCDDGDPAVNSAAVEVCNDIDDDCDLLVDGDDSDVTGVPSWYRDADADGWGNADLSVASCDPPSGYVAVDGDCDDADSARSPGLTEVCDSADTDEDCSGLADDADTGVDASTFVTFARDSDGDGWGDPARTVTQCDAPSGYGSDDSDCDDTDADVHPSASELCNGVDDDCDTLVDDDDPGVADPDTWYADVDGDGWGDGSMSTFACDLPSGYAADDSDCDDGDAAISPGATEVCDAANVDEDCDGLADDEDSSVSVATAGTFYEDADGDGHAGSTTALQCDADATHLATYTDCDDADAAINPAASEVCDELDTDEDCDGLSDDAGAGGCVTYHVDADGDGYGGTGSACLCAASSTYPADAADDCDDGATTSSPAATETCGDGVDQDCSGADEACVGYHGSYAAEDYDTKVYGTSGSVFGFAVTAGDFDGDGAGDVMVGAPQYGSSRYGAVFGFYGPLASGASAVTSAYDLTIAGSASAPDTGNGLFGVGDVNGDGRDDFAVYTGGGTSNIYYGGGDTTADLSEDCFSTAPGGEFDTTSSGNEWICGDWYYGGTPSYIGAVYVLNGGSVITEFYGSVAGDEVGYSVAGGDDVDGDGLDDLLLGSPGVTRGGIAAAGSAYLFYAPVYGTYALSAADVRVDGSTTNEHVGYTVKLPGDIDGDGLADLVVRSSALRSLYVYTSLASGTWDASDEADVTFSSTAGFDLGDFDGDGELDLAAYTGYSGTTGEVSLLYGPFSSGSYSSSTDADAVFSGTNVGDYFGSPLAFVPDMDGDGDDELLVGAPYGDHGGYIDYGAVFLFLGSPSR